MRSFIIKWALPIIATLGILCGCTPAPTLDVVKFVPVLVDFSTVQMPSESRSVVTEESSVLTLDGNTQVTVWRKDQEIVVSGYQPEKFTCSIGVVYIHFADWHVYYDCQSGTLVGSKAAYEVGVMSFAQWAPSNAEWHAIGSEPLDANGWRLSVSEDGMLHATSPLGKELTITAKKVVTDDGTLSVEYEYPAAAWLLQVGGPSDTVVVLVKPSESGWEYGTYP